MQATITIESQRGQVSGSLSFNPGRAQNTPEHLLIQKTFDGLLTQLNQLVKSDIGTAKTPTIPGAEPKPAEKSPASTSSLTSVFGPQKSSTSPVDPLAQPVRINAPAIVTPVPAPGGQNEQKATEHKFDEKPVAAANDAVKARLEHAKENSKAAAATAPAGAVVPNAPSTQDLSSGAQAIIPAAPAPAPVPESETTSSSTDEVDNKP